MSTWLPVGLVLASLTLTYFMCIRPMRRGGCATMVGRPGAAALGANDQAEVARLRSEIAVLRRQSAQAGPASVPQPVSETGQ